MFEQEWELRELVRSWGDRATFNGQQIYGQFEASAGDSIGIAGYAPEFRCLREDLTRLGISSAQGSVLDDVTTALGKNRGNFRVTRESDEDDGAIVVLRLMSVA